MTRAYGNSGNAVLAQLHCHYVGHHQNSSLGHAVEAVSRLFLECGNRGSADNAAFAVCLHVLCQLGSYDISALDVNVNDLVEHIVLAVDQQAGAADTGVVEQAVDLAESLNACLNRCSDLLAVGGVCLYGNRLTACLVDLLCGRCCAVQIHINGDHLCAVACAYLCSCLADTACCARNKKHLVLQLHS